MSTRAVFLPFTGDPFLLKYWLHFFENVWQDEVDKLYILFNNNLPMEVIYACVALTDLTNARILDDPTARLGPIEFKAIQGQLDHGPALAEMLEQSKEDTVMFVEEDAFVIKPGEAGKYFKMIEQDDTDIVGSPRGSCSKEIWDGAQKKWNLNYEGYGDVGPAFWPNFFFIKREKLLKTDLHFHSKMWRKGEHIEEIDTTITDERAVGDTFVWASLQLRAQGLRVTQVPQYHTRPEDSEDHTQMRNVFDRKCPWFHVGSLSGWKQMLLDKEMPEKVGDDREWEKRVQFWMTFAEFWDKKPTVEIPGFDSFRALYMSGIERVIDKYDLSRARIKERQEMYKQLITDANQ